MKSAKARKSYLKDFKKDKDGKYVYQGDWYRYQYGQMSRQGLLARLWGMCAVLVCTAVAAGCVPAAGMDECFYVLLPYAVSVVSGISVCWSLGRLTAGGEKIRSYVYETSCSKIPFRSAVAAVLNGFCEKNTDITVKLSGGELVICYTDEAVFMTGEAKTVFTGEVEVSM